MTLRPARKLVHVVQIVAYVILALNFTTAQNDTVFATKRPRIAVIPSDDAPLTATLQSYTEADQKVQQLMQIAPQCAEFQDLHSTLQQVIKSTSALLYRSQPLYVSSLQQDPAKVDSAQPLQDFAAIAPEKMDGQIIAIQQRAAMSGRGPAAWAVGARCTASLPPDDTWAEVIIRNVSSQGKCIVQTMESALQSSLSGEPSTPSVFAEVDMADLVLISPLAGAFWSPMQPSPYDPHLPTSPASWSSEQLKEAQRQAGSRQVEALYAAAAANKSSYTFPPGVYRVQDQIGLYSTENFMLLMADVELIAEGAGHFRLMGNKNLTIRGPLALDADPLKASQSVVLSSDNVSMVEVQVMQGYPDPEAKRILVFNKQGVRVPSEQVAPEKVNDLGGGRFQLQFRERDLQVSLAGAMQPGNFISHEGYPGGVELRNNRGVTFEGVNAYGGGSVWGNREQGLLQFNQWRSMRRPGTNRLTSGGNAFQIEFLGGSFAMDRSEVSYNWDDLSDLFSMIGWTAANGQTADTIWASGEEWQPGQEISFYNSSTLELQATAKIVSFDTNVNNATAMQTLNDAFVAAGMRNTTVGLNRIRLDKPVTISNLTLLDSAGARPQKISVTNSWFHDGLNTGIGAKGGREIIVANNWVERVGTGIMSGEDSWWGEGGMPGNVTFRSNTLHNACFTPSQGDCQSIVAYANGINPHPIGRPIHSVEISGNHVINPEGERPIKVTQVQHLRSWGNLPVYRL